MALHQIGYKNSEGTLQGGSAWNEVLGTPQAQGTARPGDRIELIPGTHTGQKFTVNFPGDPANPILICAPDDATEPATIDGEYKYPTGKAAKVGPDGDMVFGALIEIRSPGVKLGNGRLANGQCSIIEQRSRGRGVQFNREEKLLDSAEMDGVEVRSNRNSAVMAWFVRDFIMRNCDVHRASDYYQTPRGPTKDFNYPGAIVLHACAGATVEKNLLHETWSDGIMLTMGTKGATVTNNEIYDVAGNSSLYFHGSEDWIAERNLIYNTGRAAWQKSENPFDGSMGIVCNNEEEPQFAGLAVRNGRAINNILLNLGIGIWRNEGAERAIENVYFGHNSVICHGVSRPLKIAQRTGPRSVHYANNLFYHPDSAYGDAVDWSGITMQGNGWNSQPPPTWQTTGDWANVPLRNPDAELTALGVDLSNYDPMQPCGLGVSSGIDKDFLGRIRKYWTVGALEYQDPPPPPNELINILLSIEAPAAHAAALRELLRAAKLTVN